MAASEADIAFGIVLKKGGAAIGDAYSDWGLEIVDVTVPGFSRAAVDATHHQSPDGWGEMIFSGVKRQKPFTVEVNWIVANTGTIQTELEEDTIVYWKIEFPDGSSLITKLGVTDFSPGGAPVDGKMSASIEFTPTGKPTWA